MMKNKIRILHVAQAAGGVDRYIQMLLKYLDKEKVENILVCSQDFHKDDYNGLVDYFEQIEMTRAIGGNALKAIKEVRALIKKYNPDIVYEAEKTEQQIAELEERLRTIRAAQKKEEDSEIIRAIRSTKMGGRELLALLDNIQAGNVAFLTAVNNASEEAETEEAIEKDA